MNRNFILVFFIFSIYPVLSQEVIATQGDTRSNSACILNYTIGEVVTSFEQMVLMILLRDSSRCFLR